MDLSSSRGPAATSLGGGAGFGGGQGVGNGKGFRAGMGFGNGAGRKPDTQQGRK